MLNQRPDNLSTTVDTFGRALVFHITINDENLVRWRKFVSTCRYIDCSNEYEEEESNSDNCKFACHDLPYFVSFISLDPNGEGLNGVILPIIQSIFL